MVKAALKMWAEKVTSARPVTLTIGNFHLDAADVAKQAVQDAAEVLRIDDVTLQIRGGLFPCELTLSGDPPPEDGLSPKWRWQKIGQ